jgi:hypothetical protein
MRILVTRPLTIGENTMGPGQHVIPNEHAENWFFKNCVKDGVISVINASEEMPEPSVEVDAEPEKSNADLAQELAEVREELAAVREELDESRLSYTRLSEMVKAHEAKFVAAEKFRAAAPVPIKEDASPVKAPAKAPENDAAPVKVAADTKPATAPKKG